MEARCTASNAVQPLFATPLNMKAIIDSIFVDNRSAVAVVVQMEDDFTQDISNLNPAPVVRNAFPWQATVKAASGLNSDVNSLQGRGEQGLTCLGNVGILCDSVQANCDIVVYFHFE